MRSSGASEAILGVYHSSVVELGLAYDAAFNLCLKSLSIVKRYKLLKKDVAQGQIIAKTGISIRSLGEVIVFNVRKINSNKTQIAVSSKPVWRYILIDYGKNLENVKRIVSFLKQQSKVALGKK